MQSALSWMLGLRKKGPRIFCRQKTSTNIIVQGKEHDAYYYTLLGGEPFLHKGNLGYF